MRGALRGGRRPRGLLASFAVILALPLLVACGSDKQPPGDGSAVRVVTTTTHLADFTRNVAGDRADVRSLLPVNADAHDFEPSPRHIEAIDDAHLVVKHGLDLDVWADPLVSASGTDARIIVATERVNPVDSVDHHDGHDHGDHDPHVWLDVSNAKVMVETIRDALIEVDPDGRATYEANAAAYLVSLDELDNWIRVQIATIPEGQRKLVTSHEAFGYYVHAYGLEFIGAIIPSLDARAQPSARDTARLIDQIREHHVKAVFTEASINPDLARQIASEAGVTLVDNLYGDSLGDADSGAATYIDMMRHNTTAIVEALR